MKIEIEIPEEQIQKSLEESKYILEPEGMKGSVNLVLLYTNGVLEFVDVTRKTDFYSCDYKIMEREKPLTDTEQRIFLAAMSREEKVCKEVRG